MSDSAVLRMCDIEESVPSSPDILLPSQPNTDPYSSEDEVQHIQPTGKSRRVHSHCKSLNEEGGHKFILKKNQDSSEMLCEHVQYLLYIDFEPIEPEVTLDDASTVQCLFHAMRFLSKVKDDDHVGWNLDTIIDTTTYWESELRFFSWVSDNDKSDFRKLSQKEYEKEAEFFLEQTAMTEEKTAQWRARSLNPDVYFYATFVKDLCALYEDVNKDTKEQVGCGHQSDRRTTLIKSCLDHAGALLPLRSYQGNGQCRSEFPLKVQNPDLTSDNELIESRECCIAVKPDAALVGKDSEHNVYQRTERPWLLVIQVYDPSSSDTKMSTGTSQSLVNDHHTSPLGNCEPPPSKRERYSKATPQMNCQPSQTTRTCHAKAALLRPLTQPKLTNNLITCPEYCAQIRNTIRASVPPQCTLIPDCMDKMAGVHVLQLFSMAHQTIQLDEKKNIVFTKTGKYAKAIGLFIVNEYVYFSRLLVERNTLWYLTLGSDRLKNTGERPISRPKMAYGNFHLDLTNLTHRKAFVILLNHIFGK